MPASSQVSVSSVKGSHILLSIIKGYGKCNYFGVSCLKGWSSVIAVYMSNTTSEVPKLHQISPCSQNIFQNVKYATKIPLDYVNKYSTEDNSSCIVNVLHKQPSKTLKHKIFEISFERRFSLKQFLSKKCGSNLPTVI